MKATDMSKMNQQLERMAEAARSATRVLVQMRRTVARMHYTQGDKHIERIVCEILDGKPGRPAAVRLESAALFAEVLDR